MANKTKQINKTKKVEKPLSDSAGGLVFVGSLMLGIGIGLYYGRPDVGTLVGLGIGFIFFGLIKLRVKD
jgi:hypothetical protein